MSRETFQKPFEHNVLTWALAATPVGDHPQSLAFSRALRRLRIAEARFTLSIDEGFPGPARKSAITEQQAAQAMVCEVYLAARAVGAIREGVPRYFLRPYDAAAITTALGQYGLHLREEDRESAAEYVGDLEDLFHHAETESVDIFVR